MSFDLSAAVSRNRFWASNRRKVVRGPKRLAWQGQGWGSIYGAIAAWVFGQYDPPPSPQRFAQLVAGWQHQQDGLAVNGVLSRSAWRRLHEQAARGIPPSYTSSTSGLVRPHGLEQVVTLFGDPRSTSRSAWEGNQIGAALAPRGLFFRQVDGRGASAVQLHHILIPHAEAFFRAVAQGGLWSELQPIGRAYHWDPAGESLHTWGIALDIRPDQYAPAQRARDFPGPENSPPGFLLRHIQAYGWQWGLWFDRPHPGHLQFATGLESC